MVQVKIEKNGDRVHILMQGHAGSGKPGHDLVCAACSGIAYGLLGWIANSPEHMAVIDVWDVRPGWLELTAQGDGYFLEAVKQAEIGLMQVQKKHPRHVNIV